MATRARLVVPAGPVDAARLDAGLAVAADLGIAWDDTPAARATLEAAHGYLAGEDAVRADALQAAIDGGSDALWMVRGGYGCIRTLARLRSEGAPGPRAASPALWGFSDGTVLLGAWAAAGAPAWLAPPVIQLPRLDETSQARFAAAWHEGRVDPIGGLTTLRSGAATGPIAGGNLCVLASCIGTPFEVDLSGCLVVLEDTGEAAYKVDRLVTQLVLSGCLEGALAVLVGDFDCVGEGQARAIDGFFADLAGELAIPVISGLPVGHGARNIPLPIGRGGGWQAHLDADPGGAATLEFTR